MKVFKKLRTRIAGASRGTQFASGTEARRLAEPEATLGELESLLEFFDGDGKMRAAASATDLQHNIGRQAGFAAVALLAFGRRNLSPEALRGEKMATVLIDLLTAVRHLVHAAELNYEDCDHRAEEYFADDQASIRVPMSMAGHILFDSRVTVPAPLSVRVQPYSPIRRDCRVIVDGPSGAIVLRIMPDVLGRDGAISVETHSRQPMACTTDLCRECELLGGKACYSEAVALGTDSCFEEWFYNRDGKAIVAELVRRYEATTWKV